jgi:N-carbamoylputrescine amidase
LLTYHQEQKEKYFDWAHEEHGHRLIRRFADLAKELHVVLPISFFEKSNNAYFNSIAIIDADGTIVGKYRKSHIPDGPGYQEKFYFSPGDTGFKVFQTAYGKIGVCFYISSAAIPQPMAKYFVAYLLQLLRRSEYVGINGFLNVLER